MKKRKKCPTRPAAKITRELPSVADDPGPADPAPTTNATRGQWPSSGRALVIAAIAALSICAALYGFTLAFPYQFDDSTYILNNPVIRDLTSFGNWGDFSKLIGASRRFGLDPDVSLNFVLRPVTYITFHLNHLYGGFEPQSYRLINILIHAANAVLIFHLLGQLLRALVPSAPESRARQLFIPATAALLFLVHPLQTESVTYIVQRFTSLVCLFMLGGISCAVSAALATHRSRSVLLHVIGTILITLGMMSKEDASVTPVLIFTLFMLVLRFPFWKALRHSWPYLILLPIIPCVVMAAADAKHNGDASLDHALNMVNPAAHPIYPLYYAMTQPDVILSYLRLLLLPVGQSVDPEVKAVTSLASPSFILPVLALAGLVAAAHIARRRDPGSPRRALIFFGAFWFIIAILPSSSIIALPDFMAEHRCYIASIGFFMAAAALLDAAFERLSTSHTARPLIPAATALAIIALGAATIHRNEVWRSQASLWGNAIERGPGKARPYGNRGVCHFEAGEVDQAIACFQRALEVDPGYGWAYLNLGRLYNIQKRYAEGLRTSEVGLKLAPNDVELCYNMGVAAAGLGKLAESQDWFEKALRVAPRHAPSHRALGSIFAAFHQYDDSLRHLQTAYNLAPGDPETVRNLANVEAAMAGAQ